jgi:hypothetical protein
MRSGMRWVVMLCLAMAGCVGWSQEPGTAGASGGYSRLNTWTVFTEYSPTSSHIVLGQSRNRILVTGGGSYARRLVKTENTAFSYVAEIRPAVFLADPMQQTNYISKEIVGPEAGTVYSYSSSYATEKCYRGSSSGVYGFQSGSGQPPAEAIYAETYSCGWRWTYGQIFVPLAMKYSLRTRKPLQPFVTAFLGYMYTSRPVPIDDASPLNYVFGVGAGLEVFRAKGRSVSLEARLQHFSNKNTAPENPGTDNVMYRVSYSFGR